MIIAGSKDFSSEGIIMYLFRSSPVTLRGAYVVGTVLLECLLVPGPTEKQQWMRRLKTPSPSKAMHFIIARHSQKGPPTLGINLSPSSMPSHNFFSANNLDMLDTAVGGFRSSPRLGKICRPWTSSSGQGHGE